MDTSNTYSATSHSKYLIYIAVLFVATLMVSNTTAGKLVALGPFVVSGAIIIFPISYIFGDVLTEVYGYKASRKVVWSGFAALIFMSLSYWLVQALPAASFWDGQEAYAKILGSVPRITIASMIAYFCGEFANSYVLSRMKVWMEGRQLWARTIGSTIIGEAVDSVVFFSIAFVGVLTSSALLTVIVSSYILKVAYEVIATPFTYKVVAWLKRKEGVDMYDRDISYNPFSLAD